MKDLNLAGHPYFLLLLAWRGILAALALHAALEKPFEAMLMALAVIAGFVLIGEFVYAQKVHRDNERRRLQLEREMRERRAEEARLRYEAAKAAEKAKGGGSFGLDDDEPTAAVPEDSQAGIAALSAKDFDVALHGADITQRRA
ncbi:MAG: hypothetical protein CVU18_20255 [Betaproteobacteria bacterium HGW-Betaproteobacteria-12]|nr:MAG: hypothetical protein CVU18_20255 [Betaproteobacteria bacterium HGW-Betaproteobacteria-12]